MNWKHILMLVVLFQLGKAFSQLETSHSVGGGLEYNFIVESPGANVRAYYNIGERFCFGPEVSVFLPKTTTHNNETEELFEYELNLNAHVVFELHEKLGTYPIAGVNYTVEERMTRDDLTGDSEAYTEMAWGLNLGWGVHVPLGKVTPFVEYHYTVSDLKASVLTVGAFFTFGPTESTPQETE